MKKIYLIVDKNDMSADYAGSYGFFTDPELANQVAAAKGKVVLEISRASAKQYKKELKAKGKDDVKNEQ